MVNNLLDQTLSLKMPHCLPSERTVDLHSLNKDRLRDHLVSWDFLHDPIESWLVDNDGVVGLVLLVRKGERVELEWMLGGVETDCGKEIYLNLALGPLLLLTVGMKKQRDGSSQFQV
jgi:hypothetical protein